MARTKFKKKGSGLPLFPDVQYIPERKGAKLSKRQRLVAAAATEKDEGLIDLEQSEPVKITPKKPSALDQLSLRVKQIMVAVLVLAVMFFAFLPTMK